MMIRFDATLELLLCMLGSIVVGVMTGFVFSSFLVGLAFAIGLFCWLCDVVFSQEIDLDEEDF